MTETVPGTVTDRSPTLEARLGAIEASVLSRVRPDPELLARVSRVRAELEACAAAEATRAGFPLVRALVAGSAARGTFLRDRLDLDCFLLFPPTLPRAELERMGLALGAAVLSETETRYAEHPYRRGRFEGFTVDAVPGYAIDDPSRPLSAVDRTPFHNAFLQARQTREMVDQVLVTKQFLRGLGIYGSEARRGGFSGYLVELLVLRFGTFRHLLEEAQSWRAPVRFLSAPGAASRTPEEVPLILDDPVDPQRNVASALTPRNLATFILAARNFLDDPSDSAFEPPPTPRMGRADALHRLAERGTYAVSLTLPRPDLVDDILFPQLRKAERSIAEEAERLGFRVLGTASAAGAASVLLLLEVDRDELTSARVHDGPPAGVDRTGDFLAKWTAADAGVLQGPYVTESGRLAVDVRRVERRLVPLLSARLAQLPIGKDLAPSAGASGPFLPMDVTPETPELGEALADLLDKRLPWKRARS